MAKHIVFYSFTNLTKNWQTTSISPKTVEKAIRNSATHDGNLELKKGPGEAWKHKVANDISRIWQNALCFRVLRLCLEASDLQKPGFGVDCLHRWRKEEKNGCTKKRYSRRKSVEKATRKNATHDGNLEVKGRPGGPGGRWCCGTMFYRKVCFGYGFCIGYCM